MCVWVCGVGLLVHYLRLCLCGLLCVNEFMAFVACFLFVCKVVPILRTGKI